MAKGKKMKGSAGRHPGCAQSGTPNPGTCPLAPPSDPKILKMLQDAQASFDADRKKSITFYRLAARQGYVPALVILASKAQLAQDEDLEVATLFELLLHSQAGEQVPHKMMSHYAMSLAAHLQQRRHATTAQQREDDIRKLAEVWPELRAGSQVAETFAAVQRLCGAGGTSGSVVRDDFAGAALAEASRVQAAAGRGIEEAKRSIAELSTDIRRLGEKAWNGSIGTTSSLVGGTSEGQRAATELGNATTEIKKMLAKQDAIRANGSATDVVREEEQRVADELGNVTDEVKMMLGKQTPVGNRESTADAIRAILAKQNLPAPPESSDSEQYVAADTLKEERRVADELGNATDAASGHSGEWKRVEGGWLFVIGVPSLSVWLEGSLQMSEGEIRLCSHPDGAPILLETMPQDACAELAEAKWSQRLRQLSVFVPLRPAGASDKGISCPDWNGLD